MIPWVSLGSFACSPYIQHAVQRGSGHVVRVTQPVNWGMKTLLFPEGSLVKHIAVWPLFIWQQLVPGILQISRIQVAV